MSFTLLRKSYEICMRSRITSIKALLLSVTIVLFASSSGISQSHKKGQRVQKEGTPAEQFYRKGGKESKAKIIYQDGELTASNIAQARDLTQYDGGGHFNCRKWTRPQGAAQSNCDLPKVRDFILQHWQDKRRGYIRITFDSVDAVSTAHIFIEPNPQGRWHVAWRWARHSGVVTDLPDIVTVERANLERTGVNDGSYILVFKDKDSDEAQRI
jgi:hypothetical protein